MFLSSLSIRRPILISMLLSVFLIFGGLAYFNLTLNLMPEVSFGFVTVQTIYPGAGPREVETQITDRIEDAVATLGQIKRMESYSMESVSFVMLEFDLEKDADLANQEVKDKINAILNDLPADAELPIVQKFDIGAQPIMDVILSGDISSRELFDLADGIVKERISQVNGVARVGLIGGEEREIRIELDNRTVFQNMISLPQLGQILAAWNMDMPGGHYQSGASETSVRLQGKFPTVQEIEQAQIPTAFGLKSLQSLADIQDSAAEVRQRTSFFTRTENIRRDDVILLSVTKSADGNTVAMARDVQKLLPELEQELPTGCYLQMVRDDSIFIESAVDDTLSNIFYGIILTGLVLLFFLHDLRSTLIVSLAMPMSIISTFMLLDMSGFSLNMMSLMGLSTSVGILVANSVVVLENIFRFKQLGSNRREAADHGTAEVVVAVVASTLTNIMVFLPIAFMGGLIGQFFKEFALTVTFATIFSLLISFTLTPMLASLILPEKDVKKHPIGNALENMFSHWERLYRSGLAIIFRSRWRSLGVVLAAVMLFFASFYVAARVGFEFFPVMDEGNISIEVELPQGTNLEASASVMRQIETIVTSFPEVYHVITTLGSLSDLDVGTNLARMQIKLVDVDERDLKTTDVAALLIEELSAVPNAQIRAGATSSVGSGQAPINFSLQGQDVDVLESRGIEIMELLSDVPGLVNLNSSSRSGAPEITLVPDRRQLAEAGLTVMELGMTLRSALEGLIVATYQEGGEEYDIRVVLTNNGIQSPEQLANLTVVGPQGRFRLTQLADLKYSSGFSKILHRDKYKAILFEGYTAPGIPLGDVVEKIRARTDNLTLPSGYRIDWGGDVEMMEETAAEMLQTFIIALLLTYMLLAAILESLTQPLMILGTVPLALIGVFVALFITGKTMNTISMMAIVMLLGIVVNNAILLLDYINTLRRRGEGVTEALLNACPTKLKPIVMASLAIILGMMPMALGVGSAGVEIRQPMAIVSIGGLVVSTILALVVIPALYHLTSIRKPQRKEIEV